MAGRDILRYVVLLLAFVVCFLALGIPYWQLPYSEIGLPDTLINAALALVVLCGFALRAGSIASIRAITLILGAVVPAVVLARINVDTAADPTSHNLWPLELALVLPVGLGAAFIGALAGWGVAKLVTRRASA